MLGLVLLISHWLKWRTKPKTKANPRRAKATTSRICLKRTQRTRHAEEVLKQDVTLEYDERPFQEIELELEKRTGLNFILSSSASDDSLSEDEPITFSLHNMPLSKAMQLMLRTKNATYVIEDGVVVFIFSR